METTEQFSRLVHEIYDAAVESNNWTVALEDLAASVGATGCALLISGSITWYSQLPLTCLDEVGAPPQGPQQPPPPPPPPPEQAPTNAISVNISDVAGGLKVNVNNSSTITGTCTYDATAPNSPIPPTHRDFTVGAKAGTDFQINGIRTGTVFNAVTVCRGTFQGKDMAIGRVEIAKTF